MTTSDFTVFIVKQEFLFPSCTNWTHADTDMVQFLLTAAFKMSSYGMCSTAHLNVIYMFLILLEVSVLIWSTGREIKFVLKKL